MAYEELKKQETAPDEEPRKSGYELAREAEAALLNYELPWWKKRLGLGRVTAKELIARDERDRAAGVKTPLEQLEAENRRKNQPHS